MKQMGSFKALCRKQVVGLTFNPWQSRPSVHLDGRPQGTQSPAIGDGCRRGRAALCPLCSGWAPSWYPPPVRCSLDSSEQREAALREASSRL